AHTYPEESHRMCIRRTEMVHIECIQAVEICHRNTHCNQCHHARLTCFQFFFGTTYERLSTVKVKYCCKYQHQPVRTGKRELERKLGAHHRSEKYNRYCKSQWNKKVLLEISVMMMAVVPVVVPVMVVVGVIISVMAVVSRVIVGIVMSFLLFMILVIVM